MAWLHFAYLVLLAWMRGLWWKWPHCLGGWNVSSGLTWEETKIMYFKHDWQPWCFQRTPGGGIARKWRTP
jgi:hypothetical protein